MTLKLLAIATLLGATVVFPLIAQAQVWPGGGPGPYGPYAAPSYGAANPYASELNALAIKDPAKHEVCFTQANDKNLRRDARWKFMRDCMTAK